MKFIKFERCLWAKWQWARLADVLLRNEKANFIWSIMIWLIRHHQIYRVYFDFLFSWKRFRNVYYRCTVCKSNHFFVCLNYGVSIEFWSDHTYKLYTYVYLIGSKFNVYNLYYKYHHTLNSNQTSVFSQKSRFCNVHLLQ